MLDFSCDYNCGCAEEILLELSKANAEAQKTYGFDEYSGRAKEKLKEAVGNENADIYFLAGGTQTNAAALSFFLRPCQGVLCAETGHINVHESGAIEGTSHKVLPVRNGEMGKIDIVALKEWLRNFYSDATYPHMVQPGAVYISHPTEYGGIYSKAELEEIRKVCDEYNLYLYLDGARLAYALESEKTDVTLKDLGKLCDAFYIGGTKCGAMLGEALIFREKAPLFFTHRKRMGALLAKGYILGLQFDVLFTDGLYHKLGKNAVECAMRLKNALKEKNIEFLCDSPTNQQFIVLSDEEIKKLDGKIGYDIWEKKGEKTAIRLCTSWRTTKEETDELISLF